jgi:hypothetical protein
MNSDEEKLCVVYPVIVSYTHAPIGPVAAMQAHLATQVASFHLSSFIFHHLFYFIFFWFFVLFFCFFLMIREAIFHRYWRGFKSYLRFIFNYL